MVVVLQAVEDELGRQLLTPVRGQRAMSSRYSRKPSGLHVQRVEEIIRSG